MARMPWELARELIERDRSRAVRPARRSLVALACLCAGYALADRIAPGVYSTWWLGMSAALLAAGAATKGRACSVLLACAVVGLGAGWYAIRINERASASAQWAVGLNAQAVPAPATVLGVVRESARALPGPRGQFGRFARSDPGSMFELSVHRFETGASGGVPSRGVVRVRVSGLPDELSKQVRPGAVVSITGRLRPVEPAGNPGEPDWLKLAAQDGRIGDLDVPDSALIAERAAPDMWASAESAWRGVIGRLRARCMSVLDGSGHGIGTGQTTRERALLGALLLGERNAALDEVNAAFTRLGLLHLVAISGFNLAVMAFVATFLLRLTGDRGWLEPAIVALLVGVYMFVLPAQAPILRAGLIVLVLLAAEALGRRYDRTTLLGWIACLVLLFRPMDMWSLGFQLSFGIVGALLLFGDTMHRRLWGVPIRGLVQKHEPHGRVGVLAWIPKIYQGTIEAFKAQVSAGVLAWAVSLPIIAAHTGQVSLLAPLTTLIVLPLTVGVLWVGYIALLVGVIVPVLGSSMSGVLDVLAAFLVRVVMMLDLVPGASVQLPTLSPLWAAASVVTILLILARVSVRDARAWVATGILALWFTAQVWLLPRAPADSGLRVDTLAVGDGTCHLLRSGGHAMLWDCGSLSTGVGERLVPQACRELGVWRVDTVLITHANLDHYSGVLDVIGPLGVGRVIVSGQFADLAKSRPESGPGTLLAGLQARGVEVRIVQAGAQIEVGSSHAMVIWPPEGREFANINDASLVARFDVQTDEGARRVMFTGDVSREALAELLGMIEDGSEAVAADVLESPHHGSYNELSAHLLRELDPKVVLQSTGRRRAMDDRWDGFKDARVWHVTSTSGAAWVEIRQDGTIATGAFR